MSFMHWDVEEGYKILGNVFIDSQLKYAPLLSMFCRKTYYSKIEKNHHKNLKVIYESNDTYDNRYWLRMLDMEGYKIYDVLFYFAIYLEFISESYFMYKR